MKGFQLLIIGLLFSVAAKAQSVTGKLLDLIDNKPLAGATVLLKGARDSTVQYNSLADSTGSFRFDGMALDSFYLEVSAIGYERYRQIVPLNDSVTNLQLGTLFIPKSSVQLGGVTVTSTAAATVQKGDTTQFSAGQFKVNPDATTEDLIKKMPGITVDKDGTVTAQGEQVRKVTIDGKDFFGDDASAALRNLPSEVVDKIQVFDRLSDQAQQTGFDDGNSVKAINIVTKSGIKNGQFGRVFAGYGTDSRYQAGGNMSFFNGDRRISFVGNFNNVNQQNFGAQDLLGLTSSGNSGRGGGGRGGGGRGGGGRGGFGGDNFQVGQQAGISRTNAAGINFTDKWGKKVDVQASYFFNQSRNINDNITRTTTPLNADSTRENNQFNRAESQNYNHRINMRLQYNIDSNNSITIIPSLNFQKNRSITSAFENTLYLPNDTVNTSTSDRNVLRNGYNLRNSIFYRHSFAKRGRVLFVGFNTTLNKNNGETYSNANYRFFETGGIRDSLQNQFTDNPTSGYTLSGNISYMEPLGQNSQLQISYEPSYTKNKADQQTFGFDELGGKYTEFIPTLSNKFDNTVTTQNGGLTYRLGNSRDNQFSVGVNLQHSVLQSDRTFPTVTNVNQSFTNVLPNLRWRKKIGQRSNINLFYRASTNFPSISQLQDVVNNSNELRKSVGNPNLKQSYNHFVTARYIFTNTQKGQSFFANIFLQAQQNYITNATFIARQDSVIQAGSILAANAQLTKPVNLDGYKSLRTFFTFSQPIKPIKTNLNLNAGFSYSRLPGLLNNIENITNNYTYSGGIVLASNISEYIDFNLSYNANYNTVQSNTVASSNTSFLNQAASIQLNLLSKTGWFLQNDVSNQSYSGLSDGFNQSYWLWNAAVGKKFLKSRAAELKLSVFDLLKQNQSIYREVGSNNEIIDSQSNVLQQYFMLTFTYSLRNFGKARAAGQGRGGGERPRGDGPPPMMF